ncbi:L-lysine 6-monooxygenase (NADPH-requiring) domain protein [Leptospira borgpetersenii serovar Mini str. 201000851]|uniref:L-lysine 6-monooxygenase (NADPH-requiring) domain protein n=2 Tax=Leptospira borgpetersenii TaxID=174 RepID=M3GYF3_LEPBO|nr:L-lysine 6-monooxygenase (NADPH-requiring) domain protein [Leptospira borgpetersenii str. 200801926]EMF99873.1 L-lysine 6-monooxygenase (NADPH-requiring) domain protein [Leptospira borgpetersenii str. 200701203]EMK09122.1 L-lysine 6-monooxygenase (NADPH-requiring) domain protein [Leptospira sp. serovar Kenya str. Sh9]ENO63760.1 L-lysine 6-monooxygenase (NADPH-requiring) domain protein [Leptospira borgpetersenii serovar Mini str. 201000851]
MDKESQKEFLSRHKNTNYAVVEPELIENIYRALYNENKVEGKNREYVQDRKRRRRTERIHIIYYKYDDERGFEAIRGYNRISYRS